MENIIWLMWAADIVGSIGIVCTIAVVLTAAVIAVASFITLVESDDREEEGHAKRMSFIRTAFLILLLPVVIGVITPSQKTIYAAVAIKAGSSVAETPLAQKSLRALDAILDRIIASGEAKK